MAEKRIVLGNCGVIDPQNIETYLAKGGFKAFIKARDKMKPQGIVEEIKKSGLTGRGGAGFPCGLKWELARNTKSKTKYLICNADEGEVGQFKDKYLLSKDPFTLIEGMCIAGLAIGAQQAYIYLRAEYHSLYDHLCRAIAQAKDKGFLKYTDIRVFEGAGAYVCGEESALMNSIEGRRGESRYKPPYPPTSGLWDRPTIINNVETLMNVPHIINNGAAWFSVMGTKRSKGTKVFCVSGDVARPGVYELEMGSTLKELVVDLAGAAGIKAVQVGGSTGSIIPVRMINTPLSHETCLGSGAVVVLNSDRDIVDIVHNNMRFLHEESCGKCTPCREGTEVMLEILGRMVRGDGEAGDINKLEDLARTMAMASLCGLGQAAAVPVLDSLKYFRDEYSDLIDQSLFLRSYLGSELYKSEEAVI
ncbi:MAG: NADH-ubiquinone oxidoreductase-F iron-sulfur binding region domain-containing protein [Dehalococcoidia bacterium]